MMLAIDPGPDTSGFVLFDPGLRVGVGFAKKAGVASNTNIRGMIETRFVDGVVIERPEARGVPLGHDILETIYEAGRFRQCCDDLDLPCYEITRQAIKTRLCGTAGVSDANVNAATQAKFPHTGGGVRRYIGTKKEPGPLYGLALNDHTWAALALAVTWHETHNPRLETKL